MQNRQLAENKLIILYLLNKLGEAFSESDIHRLLLETNLINYFDLQALFHELESAGYLRSVQVDAQPMYLLTLTGEQTLQFFGHLIPDGIRMRLDDQVGELRRQERHGFVSSGYDMTDSGHYEITLEMTENRTKLLSLKMSVENRDDAKHFCKVWDTHAADIYPELLAAFLKHKPE